MRLARALPDWWGVLVMVGSRTEWVLGLRSNQALGSGCTSRAVAIQAPNRTTASQAVIAACAGRDRWDG